VLIVTRPRHLLAASTRTITPRWTRRALKRSSAKGAPVDRLWVCGCRRAQFVDGNLAWRAITPPGMPSGGRERLAEQIANLAPTTSVKPRTRPLFGGVSPGGGFFFFALRCNQLFPAPGRLLHLFRRSVVVGSANAVNFPDGLAGIGQSCDDILPRRLI